MTDSKRTACMLADGAIYFPAARFEALERDRDGWKRSAEIHGAEADRLEKELASAKARCERMEKALRTVGKCPRDCCENGRVRQYVKIERPYGASYVPGDELVECDWCKGSGLHDTARAALSPETDGEEEGT